MKSFRAALAKLGVPENEPVSWRGFWSVPDGLAAAIASADFVNFPGMNPGITELSLDENWTEECQGVAYHGDAWVFSSNGSRPISENGHIFGSEPKALYRFRPGSSLHDGDITHKLIFATPNGDGYVNICPPPLGGGPIYHIGAICSYSDHIYVDHWNHESFGHLAKVGFDGNQFNFVEWIRLDPEVDTDPATGEKIRQRVNLVGINPWDGTVLTCLGGGTPQTRLFVHELNSGNYTGRELSIMLDPEPKDQYIQGGAFSDDGRLFISVGRGDVKNYQYIYCYSALTGRRLYVIAVLTEGDNQELEGICFARCIGKGGANLQLHVVLLENKGVLDGGVRDNIFFKSYAVG